MSYSDRENMGRIYQTQVRNSRIAWFLSIWLSMETVTRQKYLRSMALGWKFLSAIGIAYTYQSAMMAYSSQNYNPIVGAFLRKYSDSVKRDLFEIKDAKKEYFYIDTSQYMAYTNSDLTDEFHAHHGPQPVSQFFCYLFFCRRGSLLIAVGSSK